MITKEDIKKYAIEQGYCAVGITGAEDFNDYVDELMSRDDDYRFLAPSREKAEARFYPRNVMEDARSIIVMAWDYYKVEYPEELKKLIGKVYMSRSYGPRKGSPARAAQDAVVSFLEANGAKAMVAPELPARASAVRSGIATIGRNNFVYVDGAGSYVVITTILTDLELTPDESADECLCPEGCRACVKACPTGSLQAPFRMKPQMCIGFQNFLTRGEPGSPQTMIDDEMKERIGTHIHGCDVCQDVCPKNRQRVKGEKPGDAFISTIADGISPEKILEMSEGYYETYIKPIMYNYIKDTDLFRRNAAIAIGNIGEEKHRTVLESAAIDENETVANAARWALAQIGKKRQTEPDVS